MALYRRKRLWWVCLQTPAGKRIRRSTGTEDRTQAEEFHDRLKAEFWRVHWLGEKPRRTWQEAAVRWAREKDHKADLKHDIEKFRWLDRFLADKYLDEINRDLIGEIGDRKKTDTSRSTANRYLALIRAVLRMARDDWDWIDKIPTIRPYPEPRKRIRWITREEAARLVRELPPHLAEMARFSLATGLRQQNVCGLTWDQVDLDRGMAWIHADQSKSRKAIAVPLNLDAMNVLHERRGQHPRYVFTFRGDRVARTSTHAWQKALKRAGIENFRWHDLRHTWASWHVQSGTSLQELQELGGWATFEMVLRYAHLAADHLKSAAQRIEDTNLPHGRQQRGLRLVVSR